MLTPAIHGTRCLRRCSCDQRPNAHRELTHVQTNVTLEYAAEPEDEAADLDEGAKADIEKARLSVVDNLMLQLLANRMSTQTALWPLGKNTNG